MPAGSTRDYWMAWFATLTFFVAFYALLVPLPRYLSQVALPDWQIGMILGAFGVASLVGRGLAGVAVDRWGARPALLLGAASLTFGAAAVPFVGSAWLLGVFRLLHAAGYVAFTTAGTSLVIQLTPLADRPGRLAIFGAAANVAITFSPVVSTALLAVMSLEQVFWASGLLAVVAGCLALLVRVQRGEAPAAPLAGGGSRIPPFMLLPMVSAALFGCGFAAFFLFAPILGERRDVASGALYTLYGLGIIATRLMTSRWLNSTGVGRALSIAAALTVAGQVLCGVGDGLLTLGAGAVLIACGGGLFHPVLIAHHARLLPGQPGQASAAFYVAFDLGIGLGSWGLGVALQFGGLGLLYGVAATAVVGAGLLAYPLERQAEARGA
ncbi:MAG: MFS transporter [Chloroflexota bacterium]